MDTALFVVRIGMIYVKYPGQNLTANRLVAITSYIIKG